MRYVVLNKARKGGGRLILKTFKVIAGNMGIYTNLYIVADEKSKEGIVIDPAGDSDKVIDYLEKIGISLKYIVVTHCHADHISGLRKLKEYAPNAKVLIHEFDQQGLIDSEINLCDVVGVEAQTVTADITVKDGDKINFGSYEAKMIHTPGHTAGSMSILIQDALFSGDTMFCGTRGRTDLPTSDERSILRSIRMKLLVLPEETIVYPGHGTNTIIRDEKGIY